MNIPHDLQQRLIERFGRVVDLKENNAVLSAIVDEIQRAVGSPGMSATAPFGVSWMDSWVAHWIYDQRLKSEGAKNHELATALRALVDIQFAERLTELQQFVRQHRGGTFAAPDGGPPEPGTPPAGPVSFFGPDGGPPEPGVPPAGPVSFFGPDGGPPEPGVPNPPPAPEPPDGGPPEPGTPEPGPGPEQGFLGENPWILYWFVSLKAPSILAVIDAQFTRRLEELARRGDGGV